MNILVVLPETETRTEFLAGLEQEGHTPYAAASAGDALRSIRTARPDLAIVDWELAGSEAFSAIATQLSQLDNLYRGTLAVLRTGLPEQRVEAYFAGADDVVLSDATAHELAARVRTEERIVRLERRLRERVVELESALSRLEMNAVRRGQVLVGTGGTTKSQPAERPPFLLSPGWNRIEEVLCTMCNDYLQRPFQLVAGASLPNKGEPGSSISLTDVSAELKLDLQVFTPMATATAMATAFCGDPSLVDDDILRDVILELSNSGMGAVKGAFLADGYTFAGSIPKPLTFGDANVLFTDAQAKRVLKYRADTFTVTILVAVRKTSRVKVLGAQAREGMIFADDVKNAAGLLLLPKGTRLTETSAGKIRQLLPKVSFELADEV